MPSVSIIDMARKVNVLRDEVQHKKVIYNEANRELKDLEMNLYQQMESEEVKSFKLDGIGLFYHSIKLWAHIIDPAKADAFLRDIGLWDEVMQIKANSSRLNQLMKEQYIEKGLPVPETNIGISVAMKPIIGLQRG